MPRVATKKSNDVHLRLCEAVGDNGLRDESDTYALRFPGNATTELAVPHNIDRMIAAYLNLVIRRSDAVHHVSRSSHPLLLCRVRARLLPEPIEPVPSTYCSALARELTYSP